MVDVESTLGPESSYSYNAEPSFAVITHVFSDMIIFFWHDFLSQCASLHDQCMHLEVVNSISSWSAGEDIGVYLLIGNAMTNSSHCFWGKTSHLRGIFFEWVFLSDKLDARPSLWKLYFVTMECLCFWSLQISCSDNFLDFIALGGPVRINYKIWTCELKSAFFFF